MSTVYNPESELIAEIERSEIEARDMRRKIDVARHDEDKRVMGKLLRELEERVAYLRTRLPAPPSE